MIQFPIGRLVALAALFFLLTPARAGQTKALALLTDGTQQLRLASSLSSYRDASGTLTVSAVQELFQAGRFQRNGQAWPAFGFTTDAVWVHLAAQSASTNRQLWLVELQTARMDELDWHLIRESGAMEHLQAGNAREHSPEIVEYKFPVFPLRLNPGERAEVFLRIHSQTAVHVPLQILNPETFIAVEGRDGSIFAFFFGYLAALILLSLVLSAFTRDRGFVIYSLSLVSLSGVYFIMSGYYAWLRLPLVPLAVHRGVILSAESALLMLLVYLRYFFDLPTAMPKLNRWVVRLTWLNTALAGFLLIGPFALMNQLLSLQGLLIGIGALGIAGWNWWHGNRIARFYMLAWLAFWTMFALTTLQYHGWMPIPAMPELQLMTGVVVSVTLFFVAMADRVRQIRFNMQQSQTRLLQVEQQSARELRLQMRQQQQLIRDLHDGVGGLTANVGILAEIGRRDSTGEKARGQFEHIALLAAESSAEIHNLMSSLEARDLLWPDFVVECRRHGGMVLESHGIAFNLSVAGLADQPGPGLFPGLSLLRIFKEAITNVVKHSGASEVEVALNFSKNLFRLIVRDNGRGMETGVHSGRGLKNMADRIQELGGTMTRSSQPGVVLTFELPLSPLPLLETINPAGH